LKLGKAHGFDGIPNKYLGHLPKRLLIHLTHLFNQCLRLCHFPAPWKEAKIITAETQRGPEFTSNQPLVHCGQFIQKLIFRTIQRHVEEINLLNAGQVGS
jgi:hypothetical protein